MPHTFYTRNVSRAQQVTWNLPWGWEISYPVYLNQDETVVVLEIHGMASTDCFDGIRHRLDDRVSV